MKIRKEQTWTTWYRLGAAPKGPRGVGPSPGGGALGLEFTQFAQERLNVSPTALGCFPSPPKAQLWPPRRADRKLGDSKFKRVKTPVRALQAARFQSS